MGHSAPILFNPGAAFEAYAREPQRAPLGGKLPRRAFLRAVASTVACDDHLAMSAAARWIAGVGAAVALALALLPGDAAAQAPLPERGSVETPAGYDVSARAAARIAGGVPELL